MDSVPKPSKLLVDTNVPENVLNDKRVDEFIERVGKYTRVLNPIVLLELSQGISLSGKEELFHLDRQKVELTAGRNGYEPVTFPFIYAMSRAGGNFFPPPIHSVQLEHWYMGIIDAKTLDDSVQGRVVVQLYGQTDFGGVRSDRAQAVTADYKAKHNAMRDAVRAGEKFPPIEDWIAQLAVHARANLNAEQAGVLKKDLVLSYEFTKDRLNPSNLSKHKNQSKDGEWADCLLLMYLADPDIMFLTDERRFTTILAGSRNDEVQSRAKRQIVRYSDFMSEPL